MLALHHSCQPGSQYPHRRTSIEANRRSYMWSCTYSIIHRTCRRSGKPAAMRDSCTNRSFSAISKRPTPGSTNSQLVDASLQNATRRASGMVRCNTRSGNDVYDDYRECKAETCAVCRGQGESCSARRCRRRRGGAADCCWQLSAAK
jgi:hypothetical protein